MKIFRLNTILLLAILCGLGLTSLTANSATKAVSGVMPDFTLKSMQGNNNYISATVKLALLF